MTNWFGFALLGVAIVLGSILATGRYAVVATGGYLYIVDRTTGAVTGCSQAVICEQLEVRPPEPPAR